MLYRRWLVKSPLLWKGGRWFYFCVRFGDVNGDGLIDIAKGRIVSGPQGLSGIWLNNGSNWVNDSTWNNLPKGIKLAWAIPNGL